MLAVMQSVEEVLRDYFRARTETIRATGRLYDALNAKFVAPHYVPVDFDEGALRSEGEEILSIRDSGSGAEAITSGCYGPTFKMRYRLVADSGGWRIGSTELECVVCGATGKMGNDVCQYCNGRGWRLMGELGSA